MPIDNSHRDALPTGCHLLSGEWPWPRAVAKARFSALHFESEPLCDADLASWEVDLPARLETAATKRRAEFIGGRLSARRALALLTGLPSTPSLDEERLPAWPDGIVGSITHSRGLAAAAVARRESVGGIGIDAELPLSNERARRLAPQILVDSERDWLERLPPIAQGEFVTLVFSLKESLFKALYPLVRRRFYFPHARLTNWRRDTGEVTLVLLETLSPHWRAGHHFDGQVTGMGDHLLTLVTIPPTS